MQSNQIGSWMLCIGALLAGLPAAVHPNPQETSVVLQHSAGVSAMVAAPDGRIFTSTEDGHVYIWDINGSKPPSVIKTGSSGSFALGVSSDGSRIAAESENYTISVWNAFKPQEKPLVLRGNESHTGILAFSKDGRTLFAAGAMQVRVWDLASGVSRTFFGYQGALALHPDGKRFATGGGIDPAVRIRDLGDPEGKSFPCSGHEDAITELLYSRSGDKLFSSSFDRTVRIWNVNRPRAAVNVLRGHSGRVTRMLLSEDQQTLVTGSEDLTVRLWNLDHPDRARVLTGYVDGIAAMALSPDGRFFAAGDAQGTVRLTDLTQSARVLVLKGHAAGITGIAFAPGGGRLLTASKDGTVRIWDLAR